MADVPVTTFFNFFIYLFIPFLFAFFLKRINVSPIIGYIIGGITLGNLFQGLISQEVITNFAYFGIVLLLFTVGLDLNVTKLFLLKKFVLIGGFFQIFVTLIAISVLSALFGFTLLQSFLIGIALTSSSTSIVAKIIQERGEERSFLGEVALGILMFQDLAFIPFIIIFTYFNSQEVSVFEALRTIIFSIGEAAIILLLMYYAGKKAIPIIFNRIANVSRELLNLFIIIFIFAVVSLSSTFGIPVLVGAFIAGVLVSHTVEHFHIFSQIRPLRDVMAIIFFVFIGTHVNIPQIVFLIPKIVWFGLLLALIKAVVLLVIFLYFRFSSRMAFSMAVLLFQVSENSFILLSLAFTNKIFNSEQYLFIISAVLMSLMLTPALINSRDSLYSTVRSFIKKYLPPVEMFIKHRIDFSESPLDVLNMKNHIVICGYGRIGEQVGKALTLANVPFVAVDYNFHTVERMKKEGINIIYGDPTNLDVLDFADVEQASALVAAVPTRADQEAVILNSKKLNPRIVIISRVHNEQDRQRMKDLGVHAVVLPEFEASLSVIKKIFMLKRMSKDEILKWLRHIKLVQGSV